MKLVFLFGTLMLDLALSPDDEADYHWEKERLVFHRRVSDTDVVQVVELPSGSNVKALTSDDYDVKRTKSREVKPPPAWR